MRGRLIFPFLAEIHRLDTASIATEDPDGSGPLSSGYDEDFKESVFVDTDDDGLGEAVRREHPAVRIPCQIESQTFEQLRMFASGNAPGTTLDLVFHFKDLERMELVDSATGDALLRPGDRLGAIYDMAGVLVQSIKTPPGLYVHETSPIGFGLNRTRPRRNLLVVAFKDRLQAARR